jgi:hypothetical protein
MMEDVMYLLAYHDPMHPDGSTQQLRFAQRAVDLGKWKELHIFVSPLCAAMVISRYRTLTAISDPHINEWRDSFREVSVGEFLVRAAEAKSRVE